MTLEEMQKKLKVPFLTPDEAEALREATKTKDFPEENIGWALECIQILETVYP